jgi:hypothetical protein
MPSDQVPSKWLSELVVRAHLKMWTLLGPMADGMGAYPNCSERCMVARFVIPAALLSQNPAFTLQPLQNRGFRLTPMIGRSQRRMKRLNDGIFTGTCRNDVGDVRNHCAQNKWGMFPMADGAHDAISPV